MEQGYKKEIEEIIGQFSCPRESERLGNRRFCPDNMKSARGMMPTGKYENDRGRCSTSCMISSQGLADVTFRMKTRLSKAKHNIVGIFYADISWLDVSREMRENDCVR